MKNAFVLEDHYGDDGHARRDMVLTNVTDGRFTELERQGLVREATAAEVKEGSKHSIDADPTPPAEAADEADEADEKKAEKPADKKAQEPENKAAGKPAAKAK